MRRSVPLLLLLLGLSLTGCDDRAVVKIHDKTFIKEKIPCMRLVLFPPDDEVEHSLRAHYAFSKRCDITFEVTEKSGIVCNSSHNSDKKALSDFPSSYLRIKITKEDKPLYSYYIDLTEKRKMSDIDDAFSRIAKDLTLY